MVFFTCNACGQAIKKAMVEKHYRTKCPQCEVLSCMDCGKDFFGEEYKQHNQCISENEKYGGKDYQAPQGANKGEAKQEQWTQRIREACSSGTVSNNIKNLLEKIAEYPNVPRKKKKFVNFVSNSLRIHNPKIMDQVWDVFSSATSSQDKGQDGTQTEPKAPPSVDPTKANGDSITSHQSETSKEQNPPKACKDKEKKRKRVTDWSDALDENALTDKPEKKKHKKSAPLSGDAPDVNTPTDKSEKKKKKKNKENGENSEEVFQMPEKSKDIDITQPAKGKKKKHKKSAPLLGDAPDENTPTDKSEKKKKKKKKNKENGKNSEEVFQMPEKSKDIDITRPAKGKKKKLLKAAPFSGDAPNEMQADKAEKEKKKKQEETSELPENDPESYLHSSSKAKKKKRKKDKRQEVSQTGPKTLPSIINPAQDSDKSESSEEKDLPKSCQNTKSKHKKVIDSGASVDKPEKRMMKKISIDGDNPYQAKEKKKKRKKGADYDNNPDETQIKKQRTEETKKEGKERSEELGISIKSKTKLDKTTKINLDQMTPTNSSTTSQDSSSGGGQTPTSDGEKNTITTYVEENGILSSRVTTFHVEGNSIIMTTEEHKIEKKVSEQMEDRQVVVQSKDPSGKWIHVSSDKPNTKKETKRKHEISVSCRGGLKLHDQESSPDDPSKKKSKKPSKSLKNESKSDSSTDSHKGAEVTKKAKTPKAKPNASKHETKAKKKKKHVSQLQEQVVGNSSSSLEKKSKEMKLEKPRGFSEPSLISTADKSKVKKLKLKKKKKLRVDVDGGETSSKASHRTKDGDHSSAKATQESGSESLNVSKKTNKKTVDPVAVKVTENLDNSKSKKLKKRKKKNVDSNAHKPAFESDVAKSENSNKEKKKSALNVAKSEKLQKAEKKKKKRKDEKVEKSSKVVKNKDGIGAFHTEESKDNAKSKKLKKKKKKTVDSNAQKPAVESDVAKSEKSNKEKQKNALEVAKSEKLPKTEKKKKKKKDEKIEKSSKVLVKNKDGMGAFHKEELKEQKKKMGKHKLYHPNTEIFDFAETKKDVAVGIHNVTHKKQEPQDSDELASAHGENEVKTGHEIESNEKVKKKKKKRKIKD